MIGWCYLSSETHLQGRRSKYLTASIAWALTVRKREGAGRAFPGCSLKARLPRLARLACPCHLSHLTACWAFAGCFFWVCLFLPDSASGALTQTPWPSSLPDCLYTTAINILLHPNTSLIISVTQQVLLEHPSALSPMLADPSPSRLQKTLEAEERKEIQRPSLALPSPVAWP